MYITCSCVFRNGHPFFLNYELIVHDLHDLGRNRQWMSAVRDRTMLCTGFLSYHVSLEIVLIGVGGGIKAILASLTIIPICLS